MTTAAAAYVITKATALVQHCDRCQRLLKSVLDCADEGIYDPITDRHSVRLPGGLVRAIRDVVDTPQ